MNSEDTLCLILFAGSSDHIFEHNNFHEENDSLFFSCILFAIFSMKE